VGRGGVDQRERLGVVEAVGLVADLVQPDRPVGGPQCLLRLAQPQVRRPGE
jgi:hypothetical protein